MERSNSAALEASTSSNDSYASVIGDVITEKIIQEEKLSEKKAIEEENYLKEQMKEKAEEENCYKRLNLLLSRSSIYAQFMAEKIKRDEVKEAKKQMRVERQKENLSKKRKKVSEYSPHKKSTSVSTHTALRINNTESVKVNKSEINQLSNISEIETNSQPALLTGGVMHPYQVEGFQWLKTLFENGVNGILADEMGLGKTIQSIAFIAYLIEMGVSGPFLVCGPLSTLPNWSAEFERFTPSIPTLLYHGHKDERQILRTKIMKKVNNESVSCYPVVITSYSLVLIDASFLSKYGWTLLVIDEAHRIKNFQCRLVTALKSFKTSHRMLLTGTPLQNDLSELWSLLNFILPEIFDDLKVFQSWFDITRLTEKGATNEIVAKEQEKQIVSIIHQILTPFLLRRTKAEVAIQLPEKKEIIVHAPLTKLQEEYYTAVLNKTIEATVRGSCHGGNYFEIPTVDVEAERFKRNKLVDFNKIYQQLNDNFVDDCTEELNDEEIPNSIEAKCVSVHSNKEFNNKLAVINLQTRNTSMLLRQICNHPYLVSFPCDPATSQPKIDEDLISSSGKLLVLDAMLAELKKRGHKILLFSQFVVMINILQDYCEYRNYRYNVLHGKMALKDRQEEINAFNKSDSFIFLISTKAGGLGLNLAAADTVIIYDSDWNPQGDLQAQDRCHRIGQEKPVVVYRLIVPNTVDENMLNRATAKRKLEKVIIKKGRFNSRNALKQEQLSIQELLELLQTSEYTGFVKTDDNSVLSPSELSRILDRSDMKECI